MWNPSQIDLIHTISWLPLTLVKLQYFNCFRHVWGIRYSWSRHTSSLTWVYTFGLSGFVISWIQSYLKNSSSFVKIDSSSSPSSRISTCLPQGSVLGPLFFVLFISPVANVINPGVSEASDLISSYQNADDTQLHIGINASTLVHQVASLESCTHGVHNSLLTNGLHLNPSKSEAIGFFNPRYNLLEALAESIKSSSVAGSPIKLQS